MQEFLRFVYSQNLDMMLWVIVFAVILWAHMALKLKGNKWLLFIIFNFVIFTGIVIFIIYCTLSSRQAIYSEIELTPFQLFFINDVRNAVPRSFFMNCLLFVPLGLSMPYVMSEKPYKRNIFITIAFAAVLSAGIEFTQYYHHLGRCETDDVIANTLGAAVGTLSYLLYIRILKNREESLMNSKISDCQKLLMNLCVKSLFYRDFNLPIYFDSNELLKESIRQTVFTQIFPLIKDKCIENYHKLFSKIATKNIRVEYGHNEVHKVLSDNNIPYVVLKGVASASYYKEPTLRMMGDIDILVEPENIKKADKALKSIGFITNDAFDNAHIHLAYKRSDGIVCELHRDINGIPKNDAGDKIRQYFNDVFNESIEYKTSNGGCVVPSKFHHGLILLLHTATHLTHEGVGLRHLCDWAVYVNGFSNDEFVNMFEKPLKEMGLWRFAQLLTLCCIKHLGCDKKEWAGDQDNNFLDCIVIDILNGGNFGIKDTDRYSQIKYISDRKSGDKAKKSVLKQLLSSINQKTQQEFKFAKKFKFLLPIGWICTICKYLYFVMMGKRKLDSVTTIAGAKQRKEIYYEFKLFQNDQV